MKVLFFNTENVTEKDDCLNVVKLYDKHLNGVIQTDEKNRVATLVWNHFSAPGKWTTTGDTDMTFDEWCESDEGGRNAIEFAYPVPSGDKLEIDGVAEFNIIGAAVRAEDGVWNLTDRATRILTEFREANSK